MSDALQNKLKSARMTITDLAEYADELIAKHAYLTTIDGDIDEATQLGLSKLYDVQQHQKDTAEQSFNQMMVQIARLL
ncbi:hypothetical protein ACFBZI_04020 [Moraxella sp. ZJ142]|uniref:hypothetical protein n=1 Tax=Moraxella marmotae TaxID=3344520 RepID=UPI0035D4578F